MLSYWLQALVAMLKGRGLGGGLKALAPSSFFKPSDPYHNPNFNMSTSFVFYKRYPSAGHQPWSHSPLWTLSCADSVTPSPEFLSNEDSNWFADSIQRGHFSKWADWWNMVGYWLHALVAVLQEARGGGVRDWGLKPPFLILLAPTILF